MIADAISLALLSRSSLAVQGDPIPANARPYPCSHPACGRMGYAKGYCNVHYIRSRSGMDMDLPVRNRRSGATCETCDSPVNGKGGWRLCSKHYKRERVSVIKSTLVALFGGCCADCEESYPLAVYDFHHEGEKDAPVAHLIGNASPAAIAAEIVKCTLLCANCHRVRHNGW